MANLSVYQISDFRGGESEEERRGLRGSFKVGRNLNIHKSGSNSLSCNQALKKISPDEGDHEVTELIIKFIRVGAKVYGFGDAGGVYKTVGETVTKIYTNPNGAILDADYFYGYFYFTTATKIGRCLETSSDWDSDAVPSWQTLNDCEYHPIYIVSKSDQMCVGNDRYVAMVSSAGAFNNEALDLFDGWTVKCLELEKPHLLIGAVKSNKAELFAWDIVGADESYEEVPGWTEKDINILLNTTDGAKYIFSSEMLYWFKQGLSVKMRELPSQVRHGAVDLHKNRIHFGSTKGVYSWASVSKNYPDVLNLEYTISTGTTESIEIGAILDIDGSLLVAWKDGDNYGIDITDQSNKANAVYEGLVFSAGAPHEDKKFRIIKILTKPLPTDCEVKVYYKPNQKGAFVPTKMGDEKEVFDKSSYVIGTVAVTENSATVTGTDTVWDESMEGRDFKVNTDGQLYVIQKVVSPTEITLQRIYEGTTGNGKAYTIVGGTKAIFQTECQCELYEVKVELTPSGNTTPEITDVLSYFDSLGVH